MKYGLFAPAAKVTKSKKLPLVQKPHAAALPPEASLANAAKSLFKKPVSPEATDIPTPPVQDKPSAPEVNVSCLMTKY